MCPVPSTGVPVLLPMALFTRLPDDPAPIIWELDSGCPNTLIRKTSPGPTWYSADGATAATLPDSGSKRTGGSEAHPLRANPPISEIRPLIGENHNSHIGVCVKGVSGKCLLASEKAPLGEPRTAGSGAVRAGAPPSRRSGSPFPENRFLRFGGRRLGGQWAQTLSGSPASTGGDAGVLAGALRLLPRKRRSTRGRIEHGRPGLVCRLELEGPLALVIAVVDLPRRKRAPGVWDGAGGGLRVEVFSPPRGAAACEEG